MKPFFERLYQEKKEAFFALAEKNLAEEQKQFIITANPEIFMQGEENEEISRLLCDEAATLIADGIGIVKGAGMLGIPVKERIPGVELAEHLLACAARHRKRVFLYGAKPEVLETLCRVLKERFPSLDLVGTSDGYVSDQDAVFDKMVQAEPDLVLVALGVPAQEKLIFRHLHRFSKGIFVGVGGSFDVLSGTKARAPKLFLKLNLEWLYRLLKEPSRWKRFYRNNVRFLFRVRSLKKSMRVGHEG